MIDPFQETNTVIYDLLKKLGVDLNSDVDQDVTNAAVCIDNAYNGFDDHGKQVGVVSRVKTEEK